MRKTRKLRSLAYIMTISLIMANCFFNSNLTAYAAPNDIKVVVNGKAISFSQPPVIENGSTLVPMRAIFEALGYTVEWDADYGTVTATMTIGDTKREVYVYVKQMCMSVYESKYATGTSAAYPSPVSQINFYVPFDPNKSPVKIVSGSTMLPTRAIAEALGCKVDWDGANRTVIIDATATKIVPPENWVAAIEAHCEKYAPDFLMLKSIWNEADRKNALALAGVITETASEQIKTDTAPTVNTDGQKVYTVFDKTWNKEFKYTLKNPPMPTSPPTVGSVPAVILIDETKSKKLFIENPDDPYEPFRNVTDYYYGGFTYGGCNWYAAGRFWEIYGIPFPHFDEMFGVERYLDIAEFEYEEFTAVRNVNDIPSHSIAVFVPTSPSSTPHVVFVEYVEKDASGKPVNVYFTEANANNPDGGYRHGIDGAVKKLEFDKFINRGNQKCIGFIIPNTDFYK